MFAAAAVMMRVGYGQTMNLKGVSTNESRTANFSGN